jgi:hypothetical protein
MGMQGSTMIKGNYEGNVEGFLLKHKHRKIQQIPLHFSKVVATSNLETRTPWSC